MGEELDCAGASASPSPILEATFWHRIHRELGNRCGYEAHVPPQTPLTDRDE